MSRVRLYRVMFVINSCVCSLYVGLFGRTPYKKSRDLLYGLEILAYVGVASFCSCKFGPIIEVRQCFR